MHNNPHREPEKTPGQQLYLSAVAPQAHALHITAASLWLNGSNDHHGGHERGCETFKNFNPEVPGDFVVQGAVITTPKNPRHQAMVGESMLCKIIFGRSVPGPKSSSMQAVCRSCLNPANPSEIKELQVYQLKTANNIARFETLIRRGKEILGWPNCP